MMKLKQPDKFAQISMALHDHRVEEFDPTRIYFEFCGDRLTVCLLHSRAFESDGG